MKSRVKTWQDRGIWSQQLEHKQVSQWGMEPGVRKSKRSLQVDHPSQSTEVNLGKKQKWCSLWCPWSQVQQDTSGSDNFRILGYLWTIHHRCTCKWNWTEMLSKREVQRGVRNSKVRRQDIEMFLSRWEQRLYEIRFVWIQKDVGEKRGTIRIHWNADCLLEDFSGKNYKNIVT